MRTLLFALALTVPAVAAHASELVPNHAHSVALNGVTGVAYYTVDGGAYRLVAVLAAGESAAPVRFSASLVPGQRVSVSVPGPQGGQEAAVEFVREGDAILAAPLFVALN